MAIDKTSDSYKEFTGIVEDLVNEGAVVVDERRTGDKIIWKMIQNGNMFEVKFEEKFSGGKITIKEKSKIIKNF